MPVAPKPGRSCSGPYPRPCSRAAAWLLGLSLLLVFAGGPVLLRVDVPLAVAIHEAGIDASLRAKGSFLRAVSEILKQPGEWYVALAVAGLVALRARPDLRPMLLVAGGCLLSTSNALVKWVVGRQRPLRGGEFFADGLMFEPFRGGLLGLFQQSNLSFPSGHTCHAFALAAAVTLLFPRWGWLALLAACGTAAERVLTNSHYLSEVLFAAALGTAGTLLVHTLLRRYAADARSDRPDHQHSRIANS